MSVMTSVIPHGRPFTVDDLEGMPDDGNRYELIDGMLHVSPRPVRRHQVGWVQMFVQLRAACPAELRVMIAPMRCRPRPTRRCSRTCWSLATPTSGPRTCRSRRCSPSRCCPVSTWLDDRNTQEGALREDRACRSYWILDPAGPVR